VLVQSDREPGDDVRGLVDAVVPVPPDAAAVEIVVGGRVSDTFRAAGRPPDVRGLRAVPAAPDELGFRVDAAVEREPGQTYYVQISTGPDGPWTTVAVGLAEPAFTVDRSQFTPGQRIQVRVVATNGFTRTVAAEESVLITADR
jgi:hypothetical protein